jgi:hypothetical protein
MNGIWRSPEQKPKPEIQSEQKTTTSTPNIISDRCPRILPQRPSVLDGNDGLAGNILDQLEITACLAGKLDGGVRISLP